MEDFFDQDKALAKVYFLSENDEKNKLMISDEQLLVIRKNHRKVYLLSTLHQLKIEVKKYLLPLIIGGIATPFAFLSYFINLFHPWIHLLAVLIGMLLFYIGWAGKAAFTVVFKRGDEDHYYLPSVSKNLLAFMDFANSTFLDPTEKNHGNLVYFEVDPQFQDELFSTTQRDSSQLFPLWGYTHKQLHKDHKKINQENVVVINHKSSGREIKVAFHIESNEMRPYIDGPVRRESREDFFAFNN